MGNFVSKVTDAVGLTNYGDQRRATNNAMQAQLAATNNQLGAVKDYTAQANQMLQPYVDLGASQIEPLQGLLTTQGQMDYLNNNPMFQAAIDNSNRAIAARAAAGGKVNAGGTTNQLFQNYLAQGNDFINSQYNRLAPIVSLGNNNTMTQAGNTIDLGNNIANIFGNQGNIRSSGIMGMQNIKNQAVQSGTNAIMGGLYGGGFGSGGAGGAAGAGGAGGGSSALMSGLMSGLMMLCDERTKENIEHVGETDDGIPLYKFNYVGDKQVVIGPMAQEVEQFKPWAVVTDRTGIKMVDTRAL